MFIVWWRAHNCLSQSKYRTQLKLKTGPGVWSKQLALPPYTSARHTNSTHPSASEPRLERGNMFRMAGIVVLIWNGGNVKHDIFTAVTCKTLKYGTWEQEHKRSECISIKMKNKLPHFLRTLSTGRYLPGRSCLRKDTFCPSWAHPSKLGTHYTERDRPDNQSKHKPLKEQIKTTW